MGWHRALSLETLVGHRSAIAAFVDRHTVLAVAAFIGLYIAVVAMSLPGGTILTISGGIVFGTLLGGGASVPRRHDRRHHPVPDRAHGLR